MKIRVTHDFYDKEITNQKGGDPESPIEAQG